LEAIKTTANIKHQDFFFSRTTFFLFSFLFISTFSR